MSETRTRYTAEYLYPGVFMPEEENRPVDAPTLEAAVAAQPDDGWYAVSIKRIVERKFVADNGDERWLSDIVEKAGSWIVGEKIHYQDIPDTKANSILRSNIRSNTKDGFGVKTRRGNWQFADDYTAVVATA